ncbi:MAG: hypothetical protein NXH79_13710 [Rhodobacteraceae bacterium]|nr:hypothetical protein [Paracoccaceae bacterium]
MLRLKFSQISLFVALIAATHQAHGQEMIRIDGVTVHDSFLGFTAEEFHEYSEPGLGFIIPYHRDDADLDAYIYDSNIEPFPDFITDDIALDHFDQVIAAVFDGERQGIYRDVELVSQFYLNDNMDRVDWVCARFNLRFSNWESTGNSISCIAISGWNFLKIRMSSETLSDQEFDNLALRVASIFARSAGL